MRVPDGAAGLPGGEALRIEWGVVVVDQHPQVNPHLCRVGERPRSPVTRSYDHGWPPYQERLRQAAPGRLRWLTLRLRVQEQRSGRHVAVSQKAAGDLGGDGVSHEAT